MKNPQQQKPMSPEEIKRADLAALALQYWAAGSYDLDEWQYNSAESEKNLRELAEKYGDEIAKYVESGQFEKDVIDTVVRHLSAKKLL